MTDTPGGGSRTGDEQFMILQMVQDGTISPDEGGRLMEAMARAARVAPPPPPPAPMPARSVHILVTNARGDREVDLTLPLGLVDMGLTLANKLAPGRLPDLTELRRSIRSGYTGKLIDLNNGTDHVEITIK